MSNRTHMLELQEHEFKQVMMERERDQRLGAYGGVLVGAKQATERQGMPMQEQAPSDQYGVAASPLSESLSLSNIDAAMTYQPWGPLETEAGEIVREALTTAAKAILRHVPSGAFRSVALRNIIDARMNANAGISFRGRF